jgi:hypothetical protein
MPVLAVEASVFIEYFDEIFHCLLNRWYPFCLFILPQLQQVIVNWGFELPVYGAHMVSVW